MDEKQQRTRSRIVAICLGSSVIVTLLFLMYAFFQNAEAEAQRKRAESMRALAEQRDAACERMQKELTDSIARLNQKLSDRKALGR